jgi:hypothetical protein
LENGEGVVGYQYLHGSDSTVGDFEMNGEATLETWNASGGVGRVVVQGVFVWNDRIDPNPIYTTDTWKSHYATICTMGRAKAYRIKIMWRETVTYEWRLQNHSLVRDLKQSRPIIQSHAITSRAFASRLLRR